MYLPVPFPNQLWLQAECSLVLKRPEKACTCCREALALDPDNFKVNKSLKMGYWECCRSQSVWISSSVPDSDPVVLLLIGLLDPDMYP
jgi:hypothetical protein